MASGWVLQDRDDMNVSAGRGVAVREFKLTSGHGFADYLLSGVEPQAKKYSTGLPANRGVLVEDSPEDVRGDEQGEGIVGLACAVVSLVALALLGSDATSSDVERLFPAWLGLAGLVTGGGAAALAAARARRRRNFVADTEAGKVPGYRIDATEEGKVLVRIVAEGKGYRAADFEEELFVLDDHGVAVRAAARATP